MMSDEIVQQPVQEEKKERVDELDVIGGILVKLIQSFINSIKNRKSS
jgi:hypothetical protein